MSLVGLEYEPTAKLGTVVVLVPLLMAYNKLVVILQSPKQLVFVVGSFYAFLFLVISLSLARYRLSRKHKKTTRRRRRRKSGRQK